MRPESKLVPSAFGANTCRRAPCGLTTKPEASVWKLPAREYTRVPFMFMVKKPSPEMAMSKLRPVCSLWPCLNCWATLETRTPEPTAFFDRP
ncbi:hypothetical protein G6F31_020094 [Rhizopus arrhizus]|nr:hypothetical protein G6F31_020094 [Rhizopus arrhizus]